MSNDEPQQTEWETEVGLSEETTYVAIYLLYLGACWAIANEYDVNLRTLDMALWALGGDE